MTFLGGNASSSGNDLPSLSRPPPSGVIKPAKSSYVWHSVWTGQISVMIILFTIFLVVELSVFPITRLGKGYGDLLVEQKNDKIGPEKWNGPGHSEKNGPSLIQTNVTLQEIRPAPSAQLVHTMEDEKQINGSQPGASSNSGNLKSNFNETLLNGMESQDSLESSHNETELVIDKSVDELPSTLTMADENHVNRSSYNGSLESGSNESLLQGQESQDSLNSSHFASPVQQPDSCEGRYIYMYSLPSKFNSDYVANCEHIHKTVSFCEAFNNSGMGGFSQPTRTSSGSFELIPPGTWFESDQFSLEILFHARMREYPCLTDDPQKATVFYVPFFAGLSIFRSLYEPDLEERDSDAKKVIAWLSELPWWSRYQGRDHLFVMTRVIFDFARGVLLEKWGNTFMTMSHVSNATTFFIEAHKRYPNSVSVPYPTSFHPSSDGQIQEWQDFLRGLNRTQLVSFGASSHGIGAGIRVGLKYLCQKNAPHCRLFNCEKRKCFHPRNVMWHYLKAHFCFQPHGDTPTRKGMFDCMLAGGIPVLFHPGTAFSYVWHLPKNYSTYAIFQNETDFYRDGGASIMQTLKQIPRAQIDEMRETVINLIPSLLYAAPGNRLKYKDAFQISVDRVINKVSALNLTAI